MTGPWETLVATALMGTDRPTPDLSGFDGALGQFLEKLDASDAEGLMLSMGGAIATYTQAGIQAAKHSGPIPEPCGPEVLPRCSSLSRQHLQQILNGPRQRILPEFLAYLHTAGQRIPEEHLPSLLNLGRQQSHLRDAIQSVIGKRGRWLAAHNPDWRYVSEEVAVADLETLQESWDTGTLATRLTVLRTLRETSPIQGQTLLELSWKQEKAKDRTEFLKLFFTGLSPEDEPFLEAALDDRSKDVRTVAAALLTRLPDSQLCQRMIERIKPLIDIQSSAEDLTLKIKLPEDPDPAAIRDGIVATKMYRLGQRASLLMQLIGAVPLQFWSDQAPVEQLIQAAGQHKWQAGLLKGWEIAAQRQNNAQWGQSLIHHALTQETTVEQDLTDLLAILPISEREALMVQWLNQLWSSAKREVWRTTVATIARSDHSPTLGFSRFLFAGLQADFIEMQSSSQAKDYPYQLRAYISDLAYYLDPQVVTESDLLKAALEADDIHAYRREIIDDWLEIINFRFAVQQAFAHPDS
ncbi:hypothetical protein C1752_02257 [Acaryochloris thomasi RCC1774]|uniref:Uncharacterized protein n=1 Tax=Acaryochloris thomasi RCC1774 TaxID=1764569 RepID=A0A2W1JQL6_9CYAN|nr:DUF5691 domain-containing protein [Acaryochloris thomasi]PZD73172.1 hypothetical protein C1752_02257 [Acaryochloris thomasi RCC1774]